MDADWRVELARCIACGDCVEICPVSVYNISPPPCQNACPINQDAVSYIGLIQQGRFDEALASIRQANPFPGITGRVCTCPCEKECPRGEIDEPIAIRALKRFATEHGQPYREWPTTHIEARDEKVAIVGSGPAGLMAAYDLVRLGYQITIFESMPVAGGMLSTGIPQYRLPREIVRAEIGHIEKLGVEIRLNTRIGEDITLGALFERGYQAMLLATGAHESLALQITGGNELEGILDAISFLREVNLGHKRRIDGSVIVVGGGNAAIDSARTLIRLGAKGVNIIYRRTKREMPAIESEVIEAEREGVRIHYLVAPIKVLSADGRIIGLECVRTELGSSDGSGRRKPTPIAGSEFLIEADLIVSAIGQKPDLSFLPQDSSLTVSGEGLIKVDTDTLATDKRGIFAAGDNVTGPATVIDALAAGRRAAVSIDKYLRGENLKQTVGDKEGSRPEGKRRVWWQEILRGDHRKVAKVSSKNLPLNFNEVELGLTPSLAAKEAERCLKCNIFAHMDLESCCQESCRICERHCPTDAIRAY